jgi:hypothetical protein
MEQELLNSSQYKIYSMSLDSRFADQINNGDTSDYTIRMPSTYRNIARIALSSVELPLVEFLFSAAHGNITMRVDVSGTGYQTVSIDPGNYTPCDLLTAITDGLTAVDPSAGFAVTVSPITGSVCITAAVPFTLDPTSSNILIASRHSYWGLGYYLGFRAKGPLVATPDASGLYSLCGTALILTQPTPYYLLQLWSSDLLENVTHRLSAGSSIPAFAKLVLQNGFYELQIINNGDYMRKEFTFLSPTNIAQIRLKLLDPFGCPVDLRGMDWSATLELYEVVNSRVYSNMLQTYERR